MKYSIEEIFEIADKMEKNGADFYRKAAQETSDEKTKELLIDLANMEDEHQINFKDILKNFDSEVYNSTQNIDQIVKQYLDAIADSVLFNMKFHKDKVTDFSDIEAVYDYAIKSEKETVLYYYGIRRFLKDKHEQKLLDRIIMEEMDHVSILTNAKNMYLKYKE